MFYGGLKNSKGELIFSGQALGNPLPALRSNQTVNVSDTVRIWAFQNADYDWHSFDLDRDMPIIDKKIGFVDSVDPDLASSRRTAASCSSMPAGATRRSRRRTPCCTTRACSTRWARTRATGCGSSWCPAWRHCRGGDGPNTFDTIGTLETWREKGVTPATIAATNRTSGLSRPLCPYPQYAKYKGTGDLKDAANWSCVAP